VPAGPRNPLGAFALRLGFTGYLIHGTDKPFGIGMRVTHGCMRMYPNDIETVFRTVPVGTQVRLVNEPFKLGLLDDRLMLEVHPPLEEDAPKIMAQQFNQVVGLLLRYAGKYELNVNWSALRAAVYQRTGVPTEVGRVFPKMSQSASAAMMQAN
jgi:L,D-transpeptidase ErfK/SrfK